MLLNSAYPSLKPPQQNHFWFHIPKTAVPKTTSLSLPSPTKTNTQNRFPQQTLAVSATQQNHSGFPSSVTVVSIVGDGSFSPIKSTPWEQVMLHTVRTLDGEMVWRRRRYRVRRGDTPGTFFFSVSDNGVVSKEFWTIIDVCDDLRWGLFHYKGAAQASGQSYIGAVLVTPDGRYPSENGGQRLANALEKCYVKEWELYNVDNGCCPLPPLGLPQGSSLHQKLNPVFSGS